MSRQYHYLVAGLPDIFFDEKKAVLTSAEYRSYLSEYLPEDDFSLIKLYFWRYDNQNLLAKLEDPDAEVDNKGNLEANELDEFIAAQKNDSIELLDFNIPNYLIEFINAYKSDKNIVADKSWELQLAELYYNYLLESKNSFIKAWFSYERDLANTLTAFNCRNNEWSIENQLVGTGELNEKLAKSSARDFGLTDEVEGIEKIFKALEESDLLEQEKKIDLVKWETIEENSFFHYFTIEKLFTFLIKLSIAERWISLDKETGLKLFKELLQSLEGTYEFPAEFSSKR